MREPVMQEKKIIDHIKALAIDMISNAGSGHPGIALGAAPILYTLFTRHLKFNPHNDKWINRDRFVMSAGHGSALLYAILFMAGFDLTIEDLKDFRKINSKTPGHPEIDVTSGVDMSTGPLGQGIASAVGMAMAERFLATKYNIKKKNANEEELFDYYTYVLCSDGDLMEGLSYEATSLAGSLKLNKLIVLYDSNDISLDGKTSITFNDDIQKRFQALGWETQIVKDGENILEIDKAIAKAKKMDKPSLIQIKTVIGKGSVSAGTNAVHGAPLSKEDIQQLKDGWGIRNIPFTLSKDTVDAFRKMVDDRESKVYINWDEVYKNYTDMAPDNIKKEISDLVSGNKISLINLAALKWELNPEEAMRDTNSKVMNVIADNLPNFMGGNADLASSTKAYLSKYPVYSPTTYDGRNIYFGVREHGMAAILNGLALSGLRVFGGTFLAFSDYMKPAIRMSALMSLPVTYIFTHDSVNIGPDGPTHQPIEQLSMLRGIPNLDVYRPADAKEIIGAWNIIIKSENPNALVISRNEVPVLSGTTASGVMKGAYIVRKEVIRLAGIIIATGSEVSMALNIAETLYQKGLDLRVISMPCVELFLDQKPEYREELLPVGYKTVVIEAGSSLGWHRFVYNDKYLMTIDKFGKSGTKEQVLEYCEFNKDILTNKIEKLFR